MTALRRVDADFLALPRHLLADAAVSAALAAGASYADLRIHRITTEHIQLRDGELESSVVTREIGLAVRVIVDGTWGFASHAELNPDVAADTARRAVQVAVALAPLNAERIELAPEPVYADVSWVSPYRIDPFEITAADKIALLGDYFAGPNHVLPTMGTARIASDRKWNEVCLIRYPAAPSSTTFST